MKRFMRAQAAFLLYGLAFWLPLAILVFALVFLFTRADDLGRRVLLPFLPNKYFYHGLGILIGLAVVYLTGLLLRLGLIRRLLFRIPVLGPPLFGGGEAKTAEWLDRLKPCLFMISPTRLSYGWILSEEKVKLEDSQVDYTVFNVYRPFVPLFVVGQVVSLRRDSVMRLGNSSREIADMMLYTLRSPDALAFVPWRDETPEGFRSRAANFGLGPGPPANTAG